MRTARQRRNTGGVTGDKTTALKPSRRKLPTWPPPPANWPAKKPVEVKFLVPAASRFPNPNNIKQRKSTALMAGWEKKFGIKTARPARNLRELKEKRQRARLPYTVPGVDIDGDGIVDEVEMQLSKILENVEGEDLDGDGQVTEQEIIETRVRKGKEIFARTFLKENPGVQDFWPEFRGMSNEQMVDSIKNNIDFKMIMRNLTNKGRQYRMLYKSDRIAACINMNLTARVRKHEQMKERLRQKKERLYQQRLRETMRPATARSSTFRKPLITARLTARQTLSASV